MLCESAALVGHTTRCEAASRSPESATRTRVSVPALMNPLSVPDARTTPSRAGVPSSRVVDTPSMPNSHAQLFAPDGAALKRHQPGLPAASTVAMVTTLLDSVALTGSLYWNAIPSRHEVPEVPDT